MDTLKQKLIAQCDEALNDPALTNEEKVVIGHVRAEIINNFAAAAQE